MIVLVGKPVPYGADLFIQPVMVVTTTELAALEDWMPEDLECCGHTKTISSPEVAVEIFYLAPSTESDNNLRIERIEQWCIDAGNFLGRLGPDLWLT